MITNKRSLKRIATQINHSMLPRVFENPLVTWLIEFTVEPELILTLDIVFHLDTIIKRFILWRCFEKQQLGPPSSILSWETWITSIVCICSLRKVTYAPKQKWDPPLLFPLLSPLSFNPFVLKAMNELLWWSRCWRKLSTVDGSCIPWAEVVFPGRKLYSLGGSCIPWAEVVFPGRKLHCGPWTEVVSYSTPPYLVKVT